MNVILLKEFLSDQERELLQREFPQFRLMLQEEQAASNVQSEQCSLVEIIYGKSLSANELKTMTQLRWLHVPIPNIDELCVKELENHSNVLVTTSKEENTEQIAEFAIGGILAFSKNLFNWYQTDLKKIEIHEEFWKRSMWQSKERILLQIGLGTVGTKTACQAHSLGYKVWGMQDPPSFHSCCDKVIPVKDLHSVLPAADVVCVTIPRDQPVNKFIGKKELSLMKEDSILIVLGSGSVVDIKALEEESIYPKLRGVLIDSIKIPGLRSDSILWNVPHIVMTSSIASYPPTPNGVGFKTFLYNLRQFLHGNINEMQNLIIPKR